MTQNSDARVAVYIDFDNIVISRYDQVHGRNAWRSDNARLETPGDGGEVERRLTAATVDVGAILDYASSFGTVALSRAYADWSVPANASYRSQLVDRAVDLTQMFSTTKGLKNGADIRLSVDVLEDLFRLPDLTHVVIAAGDSDYIALAQRCKRLGRFVVGIGVAGGTSPALIAACDEFELYDAIPGVEPPASGRGRSSGRATAAPSTGRGRSRSSANDPKGDADADVDADATESSDGDGVDDEKSELTAPEASRLLVRALELGHAKSDAEWLEASSVKSQIKRMNPSFNEKLLGFSSFTDFVRSREEVAEVKVEGQVRSIRLLPQEPQSPPRRRARRASSE